MKCLRDFHLKKIIRIKSSLKIRPKKGLSTPKKSIINTVYIICLKEKILKNVSVSNVIFLIEKCHKICKQDAKVKIRF